MTPAMTTTMREAVAALLTVAAVSAPVAASAAPPGTDASIFSCPAAAPSLGPGVIDPFHVPVAAATQLNADGKLLYRQGRWEEARQKYRAAEAADPDFLAPALNAACSYVRQERPAQALLEVERLLDRAYLPWSQEILAAADLGALKVLPEGKQMRAALEAARLRWAAGLADDLIFVARLRPALKLPDAVGPQRASDARAAVMTERAPQALVLGQRQEVFAWSPRTRRYRQLTNEGGRVLAMARSGDGRLLAYVTAEKMIRAPGVADVLRGVVVNELDLATLTPVGTGAVPADVRRLEIVGRGGAGFAYRIEGSARLETFTLGEGGLESRALPRSTPALVILTGQGVVGAARAVPLPGRCMGTAREARSAGGAPTIVVNGGGGRSAMPSTPSAPFAIGGPYAAALSGLPIP
jgi:hypothetical protein